MPLLKLKEEDIKQVEEKREHANEHLAVRIKAKGKRYACHIS
jgi:hypothetical protein